MTIDRDNATQSTSEHQIGRVKWFNNKAGYGFITITDGSRSGTDIFVHHSSIGVESQQYKYLVQGEYVEFELVKTESQTHEWQASKVAGIKGGKLMCETRHELKMARNEYNSSRTSDVREQRMPRQKAPREAEPRQKKAYVPRPRGEGPRDAESKDWTLVKNDEPPKRRGRPPRKAETVATA